MSCKKSLNLLFMASYLWQAVPHSLLLPGYHKRQAFFTFWCWGTLAFCVYINLLIDGHPGCFHVLCNVHDAVGRQKTYTLKATKQMKEIGENTNRQKEKLIQWRYSHLPTWFQGEGIPTNFPTAFHKGVSKHLWHLCGNIKFHK